MYTTNEHFITPNDSTIIWKYLDLFKFLDLIHSRELFMLRVDLFNDKYEGLDNNNESSYYKKLSSNPKEKIPEYIDLLKEINRCTRISSFINCWHINDNQSSIMWDAYSNVNGGIAIKSTVGKLKKSIIDNRQIYISKVNYSKDHVPIHMTSLPLIYKRLEFSDERELRILHIDRTYYLGNGKVSQESEKSIRIKLDLEILIDEIFFHPLTPDWVVNSLQNIIRPYGKKYVPQKSNLYS